MRYLLFDWNEVDEDITDLTNLTDTEVEELAKLPSGFIFENSEEFTSGYNAQKISTRIHQLRIVDNITPELKELSELLSENEIGVWEADLNNTTSAIATEDHKTSDDETIKYNGWLLKLDNLIIKDK